VPPSVTLEKTEKSTDSALDGTRFAITKTAKPKPLQNSASGRRCSGLFRAGIKNLFLSLARIADRYDGQDFTGEALYDFMCCRPVLFIAQPLMA
jgi:hypothetical protein